MTEKKTSLGKGLSALFGENKVDLNAVSKNPIAASTENFIELKLNQINFNPFQPREDFEPGALKELADSIKQKGIIQPITVKTSSTPGMYDLISGERRVRAAKTAGLLRVPAYIKKVNETAENMLELAIIENIQRNDLNPMELSNALTRLIEECRLTQEQVAEKVSKQRSTVTNLLRLQRLPFEIQQSLRKGEISEAHARLILRVDDKEGQIALWKKVLTETINVKDLDNLTEKHSKPKKKRLILETAGNTFLVSLEDKLMRFFGTKVRIKQTGKKSGEIIIEYYSDDDIERILDKVDN